MVSRISHTTFDCRDAFALSMFWKQVLAFTDVAEDPNEPGDEECMIIGPGEDRGSSSSRCPRENRSRTAYTYIWSPLTVAVTTRFSEVQALGATPLHDLRKERRERRLVLADPEERNAAFSEPAEREQG